MTGYDMRQVVDLSPVLQLIKGLPTSRTRDRGEIPVMSIAVLRNGEHPKLFVNAEQMEDVEAQLAEVGDVLVAVEGGTVGESLIVTEKMVGFVGSQQAMTLRVLKNGPLDPWYLAAWLRSDRGRSNLSRLVKGSGIQRIANRDLLTLEIAVPPMPEQLRIGQIFRTFTEAIEAHKEIMSSLESLLGIEVEAALASVESSDASDHRAVVRGKGSR